MHSLLMLLSLAGALTLRFGHESLAGQGGGLGREASWSRRWAVALGAFLLPPLLVLTMAIAVLTMGVHGSMLGHGVGQLGYGVALITLLWFGSVLFWQIGHALRSHWRINRLCQTQIQGVTARRLDSHLPFAARVGFWQPVLIVSQGLQALLSEAEVAAVLRHEQAHLTYRDTFWFFWLGWIRTATAGLFGTESLWAELLLLREMRADRWAAQSHDPLLLAESLLKMAQAAVPVEPGWVMFSEAHESNRLEQRIDALLTSEAQSQQQDFAVVWVLISLMFAALPLMTNLLHSVT